MHETPVESGGSIWPRVSQRLLFGLVFGQVISLVQFVLLNAWYQGMAIVVPTVFTAGAMYYIRVNFGVSAKFYDPAYKVDAAPDSREGGDGAVLASGTELHRSVTKAVKKIPRSAQNVVKFNRMLADSDSQTTLAAEAQGLEKFLPPALIQDLMFPMVPEHLQHLLTPYFPQLEKLQSRSRKSMIVQMNGPQGGTANLFGTVHVPAEGGSVELEPGQPGHRHQQAPMDGKMMEAQSSASSASRVQPPPMYQSPQMQNSNPLYQAPPQHNPQGYVQSPSLHGYPPQHSGSSGLQQWHSQPDIHAPHHQAMPMPGTPQSQQMPYPPQQQQGTPRFHPAGRNNSQGSFTPPFPPSQHSGTPPRNGSPQLQHRGRDNSSDIQMNRLR